MEREIRIGVWDEVAAVKSALELLLDRWDQLENAERRRLVELAAESAQALVDTVGRYDSIVVELDLEHERKTE